MYPLVLFSSCVWFIYRSVALLLKKQLIQHLDELVVYGIVLLAAFVMFKSGLVRSDGHIYLFFNFVSLIIACLFLYGLQDRQEKIAGTVLWVVMGICFWAVNAMPGSYQPYKRIIHFSFLPIKIKEVKNYFRDIYAYDKVFADEEKRSQASNDLKRIIGDHSADVVPFEISTIYFNGLRYNPRPVIQSYAAYNRYLDSLNYEKYVSPHAPEYIIFSMRSIDERIPFFDEAKTKLAILNHYFVAGEVNNKLLLRKKTLLSNPLSLQKKEVTDIHFGKDILIRKSPGLQYAQIFTKYNFLGRMKRTFYQPPSLKITLTLEDGTQKSYTVIKSILEDGVIINKSINNENEFQLLMQSGGSLNTNIKKIRIDPVSEGFLPEVKMVISYYGSNDKMREEEVPDSMRIATIVARSKPHVIDTTAINRDTFRCWIENSSINSLFITVDGGALKRNASNAHMTVKGVLRSADTAYELPSKNTIKEDLAENFRRKGLFMVDFSSMISKAELAPGDYQLGVMMIDEKDSNKKWINYTDHHLFLKSPYHVKKMNSPDLQPINAGNITYSVERVEDIGEELLVNGWAFVKGENSKLTKTNLILKSKATNLRVNTDRLMRIDVSSHFKGTLLLYSGFSAMIPKNELPAGVFTIGIEKVDRNGKVSAVIFSDKKIKIGIPEKFLPSRMAALPPLQDFNSGVDSIKDNKDFMTIAGWAVQQMDDVNNSTIEVVLKSDQSVFVAGTEPALRPDITAYFKNRFNLDNCGFFANISKAPLPKGKYQVGIWVHQQGKTGAVKFTEHFIIKQ